MSLNTSRNVYTQIRLNAVLILRCSQKDNLRFMFDKFGSKAHIHVHVFLVDVEIKMRCPTIN